MRHTHSDAGIVISASHNPPADNGFKAYWADGGQVVPPHDGSIIEEVVKVAGLTRMPEAEAKAAGLLEIIGPEIDDVYARYTAGLCLTEHRDLSIVFSPLHGTGTTSVWPALKTAGFTKLFPVDEQWSADGNFPGVPNQSPNPEIPAAMEAGKALAARVGADLVIASDPDADRLGVVVCARGATTFLNGNQIGILLVDHIVETLAAKGGIPPGAVVYKTLVTTDLIDRICGEHGVAVSGDLLVGFKYVAEAIQSLADPNTFLFGTEESHGYLRGPAVRDKDAAQAAVLLCERAAAARSIGRSLLDDLDSIYRRYGYFREVTRGVTFNETGGIHKMREVMQGLRSNPPKELGGERIAAVIDRQLATRTDPATGRQSADVTGARGNVLVFLLSEDGTDRVTIRPSGTEPKIKVYVQVHQDDASNLEAARRAVDGRASALMAGIETLARR